MYFSLSNRNGIKSSVLMLGIVTLSGGAQAQLFLPGNLVVSRSVYQGTASTVTVGQTLPGGGTATANGLYPNVFNNNKVDGSFGVTSPIFLDQLTRSGSLISSLAVPTSLVTTSFSSKSELALNLATDGNSLTFMAYATPINTLDASNANTPGIIEPGNPVTTTPVYRAVVQVDLHGNISVTNSNAYAGNNGRAAIYDVANNQYFTAGNAGNGNGSTQVTAATGVQIVKPGQNATPATPGTTKVGNFNITQVTNPATGLPYPPDKSAKDDNYRGETIYNNTLYVTKGSGGNGINTVYQVGGGGSLPAAANATTTPITILPGFPVTLAKDTATAQHPFGIFFANPNTLYVADEGNQSLTDTPSNNANAGLQKWVKNSSGVWEKKYVLQNGLNLDSTYTVTGSVNGTSTTLTQATDGLRNITGQVNADGTVTIYAITSTVSTSGDQGADPNKLVAITDSIGFLSATDATNEQFTTLETAGFGEVLRGVTATAVPEPGSVSGLIALMSAGAFFLRRRVRK